MMPCENLGLKQYHKLGQIFTVLLANHTTINGMYTEIELLIGKLKKTLNILMVASNLLDYLPNFYN